MRQFIIIGVKGILENASCPSSDFCPEYIVQGTLY